MKGAGSLQMMRASLSSTVSLSKGNTHHIINSNQRGRGGPTVNNNTQPPMKLINTSNNNTNSITRVAQDTTSSSQTLAKKISNEKEARKEILRSNYVKGKNNFNNRGASIGITKAPTLAGPATFNNSIGRQPLR